nr:GTPase HflX [bacterium]
MNQIHGNLTGIRKTLIEKLESIYDMQTGRAQFCTPEMLEAMAAFTGTTGREAMVYLDRGGQVLAVAVGDQDRVSLPNLRSRRSQERLSGIRCIHTHPGGDSRLSDVDIQSLKKLKMDAMAAVGVRQGALTTMHVGILDSRLPSGDISVMIGGPYKATHIPDAGLWAEIEAADLRIRPPESQQTKRERERVVLAGIDGPEKDYDSLEELADLADTAGLDVVYTLRQVRDKPDSATYLGFGKMRELALDVQAWDADAVIFDDELSPAQIRNLEQ